MSVDDAAVVVDVVVAFVAAVAAAHSNDGMTYCQAMIHKVQAKESAQGNSWMTQHYCYTRGVQCVTVVANELHASRARVHACLGHVQVQQSGRSVGCFVRGEWHSWLRLYLAHRDGLRQWRQRGPAPLSAGGDDAWGKRSGRGPSRWERTRGCARQSRSRDDGQRAVAGCSDSLLLRSLGGGRKLERRMWLGVQSHRRQEGGCHRVLVKRVDGSVQQRRKEGQRGLEGIRSRWVVAGEA